LELIIYEIISPVRHYQNIETLHVTPLNSYRILNTLFCVKGRVLSSSGTIYHITKERIMSVDNEYENENDTEQTYALEQVPYENHIVAASPPGMLSDVFNAFEEVIAKPTVGLAKEIGSDAVELGSEVAAMVWSDAPDIHDVPDMSPTAEIPQTMVNDIHMEPQRLAPAPEPAPVPAYEYDCSPDY
jgi:hypothetical protein